jgi:predicted kinase
LAEGIYTPESTQQTYARLAELSAAALSGGFPVIVDAAFLKLQQREQFRCLAAQVNAPFAILDFRASGDVLRERIVKRSQSQTDASEADLAILAAQQRYHEPLETSERHNVIPIVGGHADALAPTIRQLQQMRHTAG